ncbi:MAG: Universal stress protein family [Verrucomicrobiales bacterium]|nr:Universal stress protein family [Verrucomicrobiales bacterium]
MKDWAVTVNASSRALRGVNDAKPQHPDFDREESQTGILVPMDFTPCSYKALRMAVRYAREFHSRITLLHVIDIALDFLNTARADVAKLEKDLHEETKNRFTEA